MRIDHVTAEQINDSRGRPTLEVTLTSAEHTTKASVPSGKSTGAHEALELRDEDGGVATAIANVNGEIADAITARDFESLADLDAFLCKLDNTPNKSRLGANAILGVSIAAARLFAAKEDLPLWRHIANIASAEPMAPRLFVNVMNGGAHADFRLPFQEYILVVGEATVAESLAVTEKAFDVLGQRLRDETSDLKMGDEGGYSPVFNTIEHPFELLTALTHEYASTSVAIDAAANELRSDSGYKLLDMQYTTDELAALYGKLAASYPFHSIEDPFAEDDVAGFEQVTAALGSQVLIIGDDLTVTNPERIQDAIAHNRINAVLIKPNQIGSVSEAIAAVQKTHAAGWQAVCSHRSGETEDTFIADFAFGVGAHGIKAGGLGQHERRVKYERLVAIEREARALT